MNRIPYVNNGYGDVDEFEDIDAEEFQKMLESMEGLGFSDVE